MGVEVYYKVIWNEYELDGTPVPKTLLYKYYGHDYLLIYLPITKEWGGTLYNSIHDVMKVCHCVSTSIVTEDNLNKVLEEIQVEITMRELIDRWD